MEECRCEPRGGAADHSGGHGRTYAPDGAALPHADLYDVYPGHTLPCTGRFALIFL